MARPRKPGLSYFSLDTKFDVDIEAIISLHGATGFAVIIQLWQLCYGENGYFTRWDRSKEIVFSGKFRINPEEFRKILETAFELSIFDRHKFSLFQVLTSSGIQTRYLDICQSSKRIGEIDPDLIVTSRKFGVITENSGTIPPNKRKVNKKETKENKIKEILPDQSGQFSEIWKRAVEIIQAHKEKYLDSPKLNPADFKALKKILEEISARVGNNDPLAGKAKVLEAFTWFIGSYPKWDKFFHKSLPVISSQFENIYLHLKNGNTGKSKHQPNLDPEVLRRGAERIAKIRAGINPDEPYAP